MPFLTICLLIFECSLLSWFRSAPVKTGPPIPIPPLKGDKYRSSTVIPYLEAYHYGDQDQEDVYFTEHDVNREYWVPC